MGHFRIARQVALRLLTAFALFLAAVHGFRWLLLPVLQHAFGLGDAATSTVRRIGILCVALAAYAAYVRLVEKRRVVELHPKPLDIAVGALSGAGLILLPMLVLFASGAYSSSAWRGLHAGLWGVAGVIAIAALLEEIVFRGIVFRILEKGWGTVPALWLESLVFALMHLGNVEGRVGTVEVATTMVSCVLTGALWTLVFVHSRSLWVATANHAAWNFTILLSGLPLSGLEDWRTLAPFASVYRGPAWWTGGLFGPENSVLTLVLLAASVGIMLHRAGRKQRLVGRGALPADGSGSSTGDVRHA